jgi:hypothetical protein
MGLNPELCTPQLPAAPAIARAGPNTGRSYATDVTSR